jgi:regulator of cell morphogenesis and NO signaling
MELEQHLIKEEEILFPLIRKYEAEGTEELKKKIGEVIRETEEEHEAAGDILKELRSITEDYIVPTDGCATYSKTYKLLQELESDLFQHIHLENNILFRRFEE